MDAHRASVDDFTTVSLHNESEGGEVKAGRR